MEQKVLIFDDQYINKNVFHKHKHLIDINKVHIKRIVLCKNDSCRNKYLFKCFIGYMHKTSLNKWIR